MSDQMDVTPPVLSEEAQKRRRMRSIAIGLTCAGLVLIFYAVTIVRLGPEILNRPL